MNMPQEPFFTTLKNRGQIKISGESKKSFLQALISNDVALLNNQKAIYACLLTPQGKFLYDFFITEEANKLLLDCEGGDRSKDLSKLFNMYKLHADIDIETTTNIPVYAIMNSSEYGYQDPRHKDIGYRSYIKPNLPEKDFKYWDYLRISLCIPDGSRDMLVGKSTLLESNIDKLFGVSFDKGCYIGQEITARMHYRALVKKRLKYVNINELPEGAKLRSSCEDIAIALIKIDPNSMKS